MPPSTPPTPVPASASASASAPSLLDLPTELLRNITKHLVPADLLAVKFTSQRLNTILPNLNTILRSPPNPYADPSPLIPMVGSSVLRPERYREIWHELESRTSTRPSETPSALFCGHCFKVKPLAAYTDAQRLPRPNWTWKVNGRICIPCGADSRYVKYGDWRKCVTYNEVHCVVCAVCCSLVDFYPPGWRAEIGDRNGGAWKDDRGKRGGRDSGGESKRTLDKNKDENEDENEDEDKDNEDRNSSSSTVADIEDSDDAESIASVDMANIQSGYERADPRVHGLQWKDKVLCLGCEKWARAWQLRCEEEVRRLRETAGF